MLTSYQQYPEILNQSRLNARLIRKESLFAFYLKTGLLDLTAYCEYGNEYGKAAEAPLLWPPTHHDMAKHTCKCAVTWAGSLTAWRSSLPPEACS